VVKALGILGVLMLAVVLVDSCSKSPRSVPSDWQRYENQDFGFDLMHPAEWKPREMSVGEGRSITDFEVPEIDYGVDFNVQLVADSLGRTLESALKHLRENHRPRDDGPMINWEKARRTKLGMNQAIEIPANNDGGARYAVFLIDLDERIYLAWVDLTWFEDTVRAIAATIGSLRQG